MSLASAIAQRLSTVVPEDFTVHAEDGELVISSQDPEWSATSYVWLLSSQGDLVRDVESAALNALTVVQDCISQAKREPWPPCRGSRFAAPGAKFDDGVLRLWYGSEDAPDLPLRPIPQGDFVCILR